MIFENFDLQEVSLTPHAQKLALKVYNFRKCEAEFKKAISIESGAPGQLFDRKKRG
jgi:hypothetical protein